MAASRLAWFHCFAGIAGDMALGSLLDAGADVGEVAASLAGLSLSGLTLTTETVLRGGLRATRAVVTVEDDAVSRTYADVVSILQQAALPPRVRERSLTVFGALAQVEGALHGVEAERVHFHEVGGHDAIADIVGTTAALELLGVDTISAGPVATGSGTIRSAHGQLPNPAPAVLALLRGAPLYGRALDIELTTPTGAALLAGLCSNFGPLPQMRLEATGYGAGSREIEGLANVTQVVLGEPLEAASVSAGQPLVVLEANLDDATGEQLADALDALLEAGALDAWITPAVMKKGRPGQVLAALVEPPLVAALRSVLLRESGSFGVRATSVERHALARTFTEVEVSGERIRVKVSEGRAKVEHDDARRAATVLGLTLGTVVSLAEEAFRKGSAGGGADRSR